MLWFSPDPRFVLFPDELHCSRSLTRKIRQRQLRVAVNSNFGEVIEACGTANRPGQEGSWINDAMVDGYQRLHELGFAHSVEVFGVSSQEPGRERLVGGLYGIALGRVFFGESMFATERDASKIGFVTLVRTLAGAGFELIDCQQETSHLRQFGARPISRKEFMERLESLIDGSLVDPLWAEEFEAQSHP